MLFYSILFCNETVFPNVTCMLISITQYFLFIFFTDVIVQFTSITSQVSEGSGTATVRLSAIGQRAISVAVRYGVHQF